MIVAVVKDPYVTGLFATLSLEQRLRMAGAAGHDVQIDLDPAEAMALADALIRSPGFGRLPDPEGPDAVSI